MQNTRLDQLKTWIGSIYAQEPRLSPLKGDASPRRYFRLEIEWGYTAVVMDAGDELDSCRAFLAIAAALKKNGVNAPSIYAADLQKGFLLLTDFGNELYEHTLNRDTADTLYRDAINVLFKLQMVKGVEGLALPFFNEEMYAEECGRFHEWYLRKHLGWALTQKDYQILENMYGLLTESAMTQPQVFVHRDYHSRNLMRLPGVRMPGVLDFQDALRGPITYDVLSLLRDCYIDWPEVRVNNWLDYYRQSALHNGILKEDDPFIFTQWVDWVGLQRHLKCLGTFARLKYRDKKSSYLAYIPRLLRYTRSVCQRYPVLQPLLAYLRCQ